MSSGAHFTQLNEPTHKDGREVEWQLAATDLASVRRWLDDHDTIDGLVLEPQSTLQIFDTYFDTDDWRIHRAGFALRIRSEAGRSEATLESLPSAGTDKTDRCELSERLESTASESIVHSQGPVGTRVQAVSGAHALQPLFEVHTSRQRYIVHAADEPEQLGEIALDDTIISRPHGQPHTNLQRVEVEALTKTHEPLQMLVEVLRSHCSLQSAPDSNYSQGLKSVGLAPAPSPEFQPTAISASMRVDEVALANLRRYLSAWHSHEPGARLGDRAEELHDLRVAGRRLDAILREFKDFLPASLLKIRPTLKKILQALGQVRDLDVALLELDAFGSALPEADRATLDPLKQYLTSERGRARTRMLSVLDSSTVRSDLEKLQFVLAQPSAEQPLTATVEGASALAQPAPAPDLYAIPQLIRTRYKKVRKAANRLAPDSAAEAYHAVRGRVKKLRYVLEAVAAVVGKPADEMIRRLHRWQEKLGTQQDAEVAGRRLRALAEAAKGLPSQTLFSMGRLAAHYSKRAAKARKWHPRAYRKVRTRWKALKSQLEQLSTHGESPSGSGP